MLRGLLETALGKNPGDAITYADLATIDEIDADDSRIASIEGLQYATGLKRLRLEGNRISSAIDFCGLTTLEILDLARNRISGSIDLTGLTN